MTKQFHRFSVAQCSIWGVTLIILLSQAVVNAQQSDNPPNNSERTLVKGPYVSPPVTPYILDQDLRQMPLEPLSFINRAEPAREVPRGIISQPKLPPDILRREDEKLANASQLEHAETSPLLNNSATPASFTTPNPNFSGIGYTRFVPPDPNGAVGPNHYVQAVNAQFAVFDKQGNLLSGPTNINQLWSNTPNDICAQNNDGDPIALYDHLADRWIVTQFAIPNGFQKTPTAQCVAISKTGDPVAGGWFLYTFLLNVNHDYPKLTVWPDAYYLSSQQGYNGGALNAIALDRASMLQGKAASFQAFTLAGPPTVILLPSDLTGPAPPAGTPNFFTRPIDGTIFGGSDRVEVYAFHVDWANPGNSTFTLFNTLTPAAFSSGLCNPGNLDDNCAPQPNTTVKLETQAVWPLMPNQYRNFGDHESMVFTHTVNAGTSAKPIAGMRWYELRRHGGNWSINQQGTYSPDSTFRWMGSVAMDKAGDMALGYSVSSTSLFPSVRYVGRLATDPLNQMTTTEVTLVNGNNSQIANGSRWGDYSSMRVDPADGCTFWYTNQFSTGAVVPDNSAAWGTQIGAFSFPTCSPADLAITKTGPAKAIAGTNATYTVSITNNGPSNATHVVVTDTLPSGVTFVSSSVACSNSVGVLTCPIGNLANGASISFTVTIHIPSSGVGSSSITNTANVTGDQLDPNSGNNTASLTTSVISVADLSIKKTGAPNPVIAGTSLTYTVSIMNAGPSDATGTVVTDSLPGGVTFASSSPYACTGATVLTCKLGMLASGAHTTLTVVVKVPADYLSSRVLQTATITNTATVASAVMDPNLSNNTASVATKVIAVADLDLTVTATPNPVREGNNVTYTMTFTNMGPSDAVRGVILQYFPAGFQFVGATHETCNAAATDLLCRLGEVLPAGFGLTFQVTYAIPGNFLGPLTSEQVTSQIGISSQVTDPDPIDATNYVTTTVIR